MPNPGNLPQMPSPDQGDPYSSPYPQPDTDVPPDRDPSEAASVPSRTGAGGTDGTGGTGGERADLDPFSGLPIPHRTWTTRGGSQVTVAGCCLPLPLGCLTSVLIAGGAVALRSVRSRRHG